MRILVSWLRDFVDLDIDAEHLAETLTMRGFEVGALERLDSGDTVLDLEITANRPDCLSVVGIAREVATACRRPLNDVPGGLDEPGVHALQKIGGTADRPAEVSADGLTVILEDADRCPRYAAAVADVQIGPSPEWLASRLIAAGVRPINNVVDVTNYVLMELGHPLHAFDLARLGGQTLRIRTARAGETMFTLDGEERKLDGDMLVIADAENAQAIAGVMGGASSEVWAGTKTIALESAYFKPVSVRRTSKRLGLKTEASARFERGTNIDAPVVAARRALALLEQIGAGKARPGGVIDCYPSPRPARQLHLRRNRIAHVIGTAMADATVERVLDGLGFRPRPAGDGWDATAPGWRVDVAREEDLIEEVARHDGYEKIPTTFPPLTSLPPASDPRIDRDTLLRRVMTAAGFSEAITFEFIEQAAAAPFAEGDGPTRRSAPTGQNLISEAGRAPLSHSTDVGADLRVGASIVALANPLSEKFAVMRPSLLPGLIDAVAYNRRRELRDIRLFEIGSTFSIERGERRSVAFAWSGAASPEHWSGTGRQADFFDGKGIIENLCQALRAAPRYLPSETPYLVPGRRAALVRDDRQIGFVGQLLPSIAESRDMPAGEDVYVGALDLDALPQQEPVDVTSQSPPRFPSVVRDLSILVAQTLPAEAVRGTIVAAAPPTLAEVREFDRYHGKGIPDELVSLSFHLTFRAPDRTLTDAEVQQAMDAIVSTLSVEHRAVRR
ncbi:MAG: phenylalanine--tRNA ligase subunit beta [Bacteroidales bacterium]